MGLFRFDWFYRIVRRNTKPIPSETALIWKKRLSVAYAIIAWNAFGVVLYMMFTDRADWPSYYGLKTDEERDKRPAVYFAETLGIQKATILSFKGFTKTGEMNYENPNKNQETGRLDITKKIKPPKENISIEE